MRKLIIIPAFNEEKNIAAVIKDITTNALGFDYVIINDSSTDNTYQVCKFNDFNIITLPVNLGIGGAVQTGFMYALLNNYDLAVQFDGDGQHSALYLNDMVQEMEDKNLDMIIGSRFIKNDGFQSSFSRRIGIVYFSLLIKILTKKNITDPTSGFRLINKKIIKMFCKYYPKDYPEPESVVSVLRNNYKVGEIPVIMSKRTEGKSSINLIRSIYYMVKVSIAIFIDVIKKNTRGE